MKRLIILLLIITGCSKEHFMNVNTDPAATGAEEYQPDYLLTTTQLNYTGSADNAYEVSRTEINGIAMMIQHMAAISDIFYGDKYMRDPGSWGAYFDRAYTAQVRYVVDLMQLTKGKPQYANLYQMARIMKALVFERLTDIYGDVPYFQAGLGYYERIYSPKYDRQQDIYPDLLHEVAEATDSLNEQADKPKGDMFYTGESDQIAHWKRFGNTLLLRMAMRLSKVQPDTAKAYVQKVLGKTMQSNNDNAYVYHSEEGGWITENRIAIYMLTPSIRENGKLSATFINFLKQDPRLPVLAERPDGVTDVDSLEGLPNGFDDSGDANTSITTQPGWLGSLDRYVQPATLLVNYTAPSFILTYAESEFLLADAAARWGIGDAATHYHNGVVAAITELSAYGAHGSIEKSVAEDYYNAHPYDAAHGLEMINTQFWAATFFNDYEAWSNWRRTGYPALTPVNYHGNASNGQIPRRMAYPVTEKQSNSTNYNAAVAASLPGGDNISGRVWWDSQ
jgi:hypothetical protein